MSTSNTILILIAIMLSFAFFGTFFPESIGFKNAEKREIRGMIEKRYDYLSTEVDIEAIIELELTCNRYSDGCNICENGECTEKFCEKYSESRCLDSQ